MNEQVNNEEDVIDLLEIFRLLRSRLWIIIASTIAGALIVGLYSMFLIDPKYESTSMIYILTASSTMGISLSDLQTSSSLAGDYEEMIYSRPVLEEVVENLSLQMTYKQLKNIISVTNTDNTRMLRITVTYTDPTIAMQIANELASVAKTHIKDTMDVEEPRIVEPAVVPEDRVSPNNKKNAAIGGILGLVLSAAVIIVRYLMDNTLASAEDVEKYLGLNTLASIPFEGGMDDGVVKRKQRKRLSGVRKAN